MKKYVSPELSMIHTATEDILNTSTTITYNLEAGEYWVGGSADWWSGN